jgi:hypothetical protein
MKPVIDAFVRDLDRASDLIAAIRLLRRPPPTPPGHPGLPEFQLNLVRELSFLRCVLAWEVFLEDSFVVYLTGGGGQSGRKAKTHVTATTGPQARSVLLGGQDYLSWSGADVIKRRARVWFSDGEPYVSALTALATNKEIRVVRNRIAHNSGEASTKFSKLRAQKITNAAARRGMGPGAFLARAVKGHASRFDAYVVDLRTAATAIAQN